MTYSDKTSTATTDGKGKGAQKISGSSCSTGRGTTPGRKSFVAEAFRDGSHKAEYFLPALGDTPERDESLTQGMGTFKSLINLSTVKP